MTAPGATLSVVIVNYQARSLLVRCLDSLTPDSSTVSLEVIVVDNGSTDGSVEAVRGGFPNVTLIANPDNVGLSRAFNQGARAATGRYVLFLDNDTIVQPDALDVLCAFLDAHPDVWAAAPKITYPDGTIQGTIKALPSPAAAAFGRNSVLTRAWPGNPISRNYLIYRNHDFTAPFPVGSAATCALMVWEEALEQIGAMDERYFVYWVDVDWCQRAWAAGHSVYCVPDAVIVHDEHQGAGAAPRLRSVRAIKDFHRGAYVYFDKHHARALRPVLLPVSAALLATRALMVIATTRIAWYARRSWLNEWLRRAGHERVKQVGA